MCDLWRDWVEGFVVAPKPPLKFVINIHDGINFPSVAMMEMHLNTVEYS